MRIRGLILWLDEIADGYFADIQFWHKAGRPGTQTNGRF